MDDRSWPTVIAHRGAPKYIPENTLLSLKKAKELGATWVEFDVMLTKDGVPVIMHDKTLNRTTSGRGRLKNYTYQELLQFDAGGGQKIPTLEQWLLLARELEMGVNIELKEVASLALDITQKVYDLLGQIWNDTLPQPLISSATYACVTAYRQLDRHARIAYIVDGLPLGWKVKLARLHACAIVINYKKINQKKVSMLHQAGYKVLAYTVNDADVFGNLMEMGVDSCFTDDLKTTHTPDAVQQN